jgi:hypothetical protein
MLRISSSQILLIHATFTEKGVKLWFETVTKSSSDELLLFQANDQVEEKWVAIIK